MALVHLSSPHLENENATNQVMLKLVLATLPAFAVLFYLFGWGVVTNLLIAVFSAWGFEALMLKLRKKPVWFYLKDNSALVTGVLIGLAFPPALPWWIIVVAVGFAVIFGKHLYGGLGQNPFNPAMLGYVLVLISFTAEMSRWIGPGLGMGFELTLVSGDSVGLLQTVFGGQLMPDAITAATYLDTYPTAFADLTQKSVQQTNAWVYVNVAFLAGGLLLLWQRVTTWHIPASFLAGLLAPIMVMIALGYSEPQSLILMAFSGATMMGAFFIVTDPVSAATSKHGRLLYGFSIGFIVFVIRQWGGYPDGVAFAVLLMNIAVPAIDYFTRPTAYGHVSAKSKKGES